MSPRRDVPDITPDRQGSGRNDEREFWEKYPKASRYWPPAEREMFQAYIPGWYPGCDLSTVEHQQQKLDPNFRVPLWDEWPAIRRAWPATLYLPPLNTRLGRGETDEAGRGGREAEGGGPENRNPE